MPSIVHRATCPCVRRSARACSALAIALGLMLSGKSAVAVVLGSASNGNVDAASLDASLAASGDPGLPLFGNVGTSSTGGASVTYLGGGWAITAGHVTIGSAFGTVKFGGVGFTVDDSSLRTLHDPNNNSIQADLKLFRLTTTPALPNIYPSLINATPVSIGSRQIMIGNGLNLKVNGDETVPVQDFWSVDKTGVNWAWTSVPPPGPATPGGNDYSGFDIDVTHTIRWGENNVANTGVVRNSTQGYTVNFDNLTYTGVPPLASEAMGTNGDSGGAVFSLVGGQWKLTGIMLAVADALDQQPSPTTLFGNSISTYRNFTFIADLSKYRDEILTIVPEPSSFMLAALAGLALAACCRRRKAT